MSEISTAHVRGISAFNRPATLGMESLAILADFGVAALGFAASLKVLSLSPTPGWSWFAIFAGEWALLWLMQKLLLGRTFGEFAWHLRPAKATRVGSLSNLHFRLNQMEKPGNKMILSGIILTVLPWALGASLLQHHFAKQPLFQAVDGWEIPPFLPKNLDQEIPPQPLHEEVWITAPFFYSLGAWPKTFRGKPVFYSIPYEAAPPHRFVGKIRARWLPPEIQLTFEGPKTPPALQEMNITRDDLRACFRAIAARHSLWSCLKIRETSLKRHLNEMNETVSQISAWTIKWFTVPNSALPPEERIEGFYIHAQGAGRFQARFVLVTGRGTHQALILDGGTTPDGDYALKLLENAVGSLRINDTLNNGKAWVDQQLAHLRMPSPETLKSDPRLLEKLSAAQALLVAKLSVDTKTFLTYNYLADISLLLLKYGTQRQIPDLAAAAKPMIFSAYRFGQDVMEADPERAVEKNGQWNQLQNTYFESKKY